MSVATLHTALVYFIQPKTVGTQQTCVWDVLREHSCCMAYATQARNRCISNSSALTSNMKSAQRCSMQSHTLSALLEGG